jgi:hypothetical protein
MLNCIECNMGAYEHLPCLLGRNKHGQGLAKNR